MADARGRYFDTVDLVNRLEEEGRLGKAGALAAQLSRLDLVVSMSSATDFAYDR